MNIKMDATISEHGNGFPSVGDYVPGNDGELYLVEEVTSRIHTAAAPGLSSWISARVSIASWDDCEEGDVFQASCSLKENEEEREFSDAEERFP